MKTIQSILTRKRSMIAPQKSTVFSIHLLGYALLLLMMNYGVPGANAQNEQWESNVTYFMRQKQEECALQYRNVTLLGIDPAFHCPPSTDGLTCWPPTAPGSRAEIPCPETLDIHQMTPPKVHRLCYSNATWATPDLLELYGEQGACRCVHCYYVLVLSILTYAISLTACAIAFIIFMCSRTLHCTRNRIHWHLITSFMLKYILFFINMAVVNVDSVHVKRLVQFFLFYVEQTNYFWMFVEGLYLHTLVVFALRIDADKISFLVYCVIGWCMPLVFVAVFAIVSATLNPESDFVNQESPIAHLYACIIGPILLVLVINCFFLLNIVRLLMNKLRMQTNRASDVKHYRRAARATLVLVILLGVGYILTICLPFIGNTLPPAGKVVTAYASMLLSGTQGLAVAVIYVFLNTEVRSVLRRKWRRRFGNTSPSCLCRRRAKPRTSSYSKYDDQTCMSTMRSMAHNDTITDCYHDDDIGHRGHHQGIKSGNGSAGKFGYGDAHTKGKNEKMEMQVVKSNGTVGKWDRTEEGEEVEEAEPLLEEGGNPPKPTAIVISEATPEHETAKDIEPQEGTHND